MIWGLKWAILQGFCWLWMGHMTVHWHLGLDAVQKAILLNINITLNKRLEFKDARINVFMFTSLTSLHFITQTSARDFSWMFQTCRRYFDNVLVSQQNLCKQFFHICFVVFMLFPFIFKQQHSVSIYVLDNVPPQNALFKLLLCVGAVGFLESVGIAITIL